MIAALARSCLPLAFCAVVVPDFQVTRLSFTSAERRIDTAR